MMYTHSTPEFTRRWWFWPLIGLIALTFFLTLGLVLQAASATPHEEPTNAEGSCAPAFLQQIDREHDGTAALPTLARFEEILQQLDAPDTAETPACAAP